MTELATRTRESPVHVPGRTARWTTSNVGEGLPGIMTPLTWSSCFPAAESGRPLRIELDATDALGRELHAEGRGLNALVWSVYDRTYQLPCTTRWEFDGQSTTGEDWSCIPTELARRMLRSSSRP